MAMTCRLQDSNLRDNDKFGLFSFFSKTPKNARIFVAYSGGVDSHVLLHACAHLRDTRLPWLDLYAIHVHHGLLPEAGQWAAHAMTVCEDLNIPCEVVKVKIQRQRGESLEAAARNARYTAFLARIQKNDWLLTAHHLDDQAETCLLQLFRGAGLKGLSAMPISSAFGEGVLARPFLSVSRNELLAYAKAQALDWIEDSSNHDTRFSRNFLRYRVMPLLKEHFKNLARPIARASEHSSEAESLLSQMAREDLEQLCESSLQATLPISNLQKLSKSRLKNLLRYWISMRGFLLPSAIKLEHILFDVIFAKKDAMPCVAWQGAQARRFQDALYLLKPLLKHDASITLDWDLKDDLALPLSCGDLCLQARRVVGQGLSAKFCQKGVKVRFRQGGETLCLKGRRGTRQLKALFQEWGIAPWLRDRIPLVYIDEQLVMVVGYAVANGFDAMEGEEGIVIEVRERSCEICYPAHEGAG